MDTWLHSVEAWREYYLLVGTAGAALVGLMFVVVSLGPDVVAQSGTNVRAFCTPVIMNFSAALVISAVMMAPVFGPWILSIAAAILGTAGVTYQYATRAHRQWRENNLPGIDWVWFVGLPYLGYGWLFASAVALWHEMQVGLIGVAASALLFIVIGIRNAWDIVVWIAQKPRDSRQSAP